MKSTWLSFTAALLGLAGVASADIVVSQGDSAPTYSTTLNFDEAGQPTGSVSPTYWQPGYGVTIAAGDGNPIVNDWTGVYGPWLGTGNSLFGNFGVFMTFDNDLTEFSGQVWDPSGPPSPISGGMAVVALLNGAEVAFTMVTPAWGTDAGSWFNIVGTGGSTFDELRFVGFGFTPETFADNLSWNAVPAPSAVAILGLAGLAARRRRG